jgi:predicted RNA-binding Zn-ribbon protein involved in translation (DUF1610 family)
MPRRYDDIEDGPDDSDIDDGPDDADIDDGDDSETVPCPECGEEVYEDADRCPECGANIIPSASRGALSGRPWWWVALGVLGIGAMILAALAGR